MSKDNVRSTIGALSSDTRKFLLYTESEYVVTQLGTKRDGYVLKSVKNIVGLIEENWLKYDNKT